MKARMTFHYRDHLGNIALASAGGDIPDADVAALRGDPRVEPEAADDNQAAEPTEEPSAPAEPQASTPEPTKPARRSRKRS